MKPAQFTLDDLTFPSASATPRFGLDDFQWPGVGGGPTFTGLAALIQGDLGIFDTSMLDLSKDLEVMD